MGKVNAIITGVGGYVPDYVLNNEELSRMVDTSDEWIQTRVGIKERRILTEEGLGTSYMARKAAKQLLQKTGVDPDTIDALIVTTTTPDYKFPSTASIVLGKLGLKNAFAFDLSAACCGFLYTMDMAASMIQSGRYKKIIVIGADKMSSVVDYTDRQTCVLFGDGGGAAVVEWDEGRAGVLATYMKNDDDDTNALTCPSAFDSPQPFDVNGVSKEAAVAGDPGSARIDEELGVTEAVAAGRPRQSLFMHGQTIFKFAASAMGNAIDEVCKRADVDIDDVKLIVPHQANERIIKYAAKRCGLSLDRFQVSIGERGNASSACVPMALSDAYESGRIQKGDKVILVAFGGGLTSGAVLYEV